MVSRIYVGLDLLWLLASAGAMSSSWLHVTGAMVGFPVGIILLKRGMVDCEGWDMFHVWRGDYGAFRDQEKEDAEIATKLEQRQKKKDADQLTAAKLQVRKYLAEGHAPAALALYDKMQEVGDGLELSEDETVAMIQGLHIAKKYADSAPFMATLIEHRPEQASPLRLKLAQICVVELDRPGRALELLDAVDAKLLKDSERTLMGKIHRRAQQMQQQGVVELDDACW